MRAIGAFSLVIDKLFYTSTLNLLTIDCTWVEETPDQNHGKNSQTMLICLRQ